MMSALTRKHAEALRLLETYNIYKDSEDPDLRRKAHIDLDRFLMANRDTAIICMERVLAEEIKELRASQRSKPGLLARLRLWRLT